MSGKRAARGAAALPSAARAEELKADGNAKFAASNFATAAAAYSEALDALPPVAMRDDGELQVDLHSHLRSRLLSNRALCRLKMGGADNADALRARVTEFYQKHNPSKLPKVEAILFRYRGRETELLRDLTSKYVSVS